ncbi:hypothetical protein [uncultured Hyphomicrobium sp.]|uniref:hypothetical protein n=1 Tax=uncultured Hyphomicrobium sp. TaxID=194373 RepID=UPI0025F34C51|nr:hypothetical protein [uncultured Hyphomicrobium sp.]
MKTMQRGLAVVSALLLCVGVANGEEASNAALTEDECRAIWNTAAGRSDLGPEGAKPYIDSFDSVDTNRDQKISNAEFKAGCKAGLVHKLRRAQ